MIHHALRYVIGVAGLSLLLAQAQAQVRKPAPPPPDRYRTFLRPPETALDYWAAVQYEIEVGKYNLAAEDLKGFIAKKPTDQELLQIEEQEGISAFLRLLTIPELRGQAKPLVARVSEVVKAHLKDPDRIRLFVKNLSASPEERQYALAELSRSGAAAVPYLLDAWRSAGAGSDQAKAIASALVQLPARAASPMRAALDARDPDRQLMLIEVVESRGDTGAVPYLWSLWASPSEPQTVREKAEMALRVLYLRGDQNGNLPSARVELTREAERYYRHEVRFTDPQAVAVWRWSPDEKRLVSQVLNADQAEEFYGLKFARAALELDPAYPPAQVAFLSIAVEKAFGGRLGQPLSKSAPGVNDVLRIVNPDLVSRTLDRALNEHRLPVILGTVRALGDEADVRALESSPGAEPPLVRALYYPDRRVSLSAADSMLRIPGRGAIPYGARIVEVLRRAAAADPVSKAVVADFNTDRGHAVALALQSLGHRPEVVQTGREALRRLERAADVDVVLVDSAIPDPPLPYFLGQLRADVNVGLLPVLVTFAPDREGKVAPDTEPRLHALVRGYRNVWVVPTAIDSDALKRDLARYLAGTGNTPLSDEERHAQAAVGILWLKRLATGEIPGYDVRPAEDAILKDIDVPELAALAIEAAGGLRGRNAQRALADVVLKSPAPELRSLAAIQLTRHVQEYGLALAPVQVRALDDLYRTTTDAKLKANVASVLGSTAPDARVTGERLQSYRPTFAAPARPPEAPKEK